MEQAQAEKEDILARLRRIEGQIRGIQGMIEKGRDCEAIVTQLMAARAALDKAGLTIISYHLEQCLTSPAESPSRERLERIIKFFMKFATTPFEPEV